MAHRAHPRVAVQVHVTELDISPDSKTYYGGCSTGAQRAAVQARVYASVLRTCARARACEALVLWAPSDAHTDRGNLTSPPGLALLDAGYRPKPAFWAMARELDTIHATAHR